MRYALGTNVIDIWRFIQMWAVYSEPRIGIQSEGDSGSLNSQRFNLMQRITFIFETMHSMDMDQMETEVPNKILSRLENRNLSWRRLMADVGCSAWGKDLQGTQWPTSHSKGWWGSGYCRKRKTAFSTLCDIRGQTNASIWLLTNTCLCTKTGMNGWKLHKADYGLKGVRIHYQKSWNQIWAWS